MPPLSPPRFAGRSAGPRSGPAGWRESLIRDHTKRSSGIRQEPAPIGLDDDIVLDPHPAPTRDVDPWLDREHHPDLEHRLRAWVERRVLVRLEAEPVADTVEKPIAQPGGLDDLSHR